jgi:hypothetical protein
MALAAPVGDPTIPPKGWSPPKNAMGQPDISGYWSNATMTPLMRNARVTNKATLSATEARALEQTFAAALEEADKPTDPDAPTTPATDAKAAEAKLIAIRPDLPRRAGMSAGTTPSGSIPAPTSWRSTASSGPPS